MDVNHVTLNVSSGDDTLSQLLGIGSPINLPMHVVVTADSIEQAVERAGTKQGNKGWDAASAAIEMANLLKSM